MPKLFSIEEANALIPAIAEIMTRVRERKQELDRYQEQVNEIGAKARGNGHTRQSSLRKNEADARRAADALNKAIEEVTALGIEVKDLEQGLVDFPHERDGKIVYLCWRLGEPSIGWWHEIEAGFRGRQPL